MKNVTGCFLFSMVLSIWALIFFMYSFKEEKEIETFYNSLIIPDNVTMYNDEYCIGYNFLEAEKTFREDGLEPVSLAIHGTAEMMNFFEAKPKNWDGPISLGLFIDFHSRRALEYIALLHRCDQEFREKVTVHFAFRVNPYLAECPSDIPIAENSCSDFLDNQNELRAAINGPFQVYPINLMRNIARKGAKSDLHFLVDADMVLSEGFATKVKPIANEMIDGASKKMLVVRKFETENKIIPRDQFELLDEFNNKRVFEFHRHFFYAGHRIPDVYEWFNNSAFHHEIVSKEIPYGSYKWEVQGILHRNDLYNPDYFPSRVMDMQSLIYSLCRADYTFHVISQVFTVHEGIKRGNSMYSQVVAAYTKKYSGVRAMNRYIREMDQNYPNSVEKCGGQFSLN